MLDQTKQSTSEGFPKKIPISKHFEAIRDLKNLIILYTQVSFEYKEMMSERLRNRMAEGIQEVL